MTRCCLKDKEYVYICYHTSKINIPKNGQCFLKNEKSDYITLNTLNNTSLVAIPSNYFTNLTCQYTCA